MHLDDFFQSGTKCNKKYLPDSKILQYPPKISKSIYHVNFKIRKDQKMDNQQISDKCNSCRNSPYHQSMYFCNIRKKIRCSKLTKERINVSLQSAKVFMEEEKIV